MYEANTIVKDAPQRADEETFKQYAALPSWHIEAAASLAAGYVPRKYLFAKPICPTSEFDDQAAPDSNWCYLLLSKNPVGRTIDLYALAQKMIGRAFPPDMVMVEPEAFIDFCDKYDVAVTFRLRNAWLQFRRHRLGAEVPGSDAYIKQRHEKICDCIRSMATLLEGTKIRITSRILLNIFLLTPGNISFHGFSERAFRDVLAALRRTLPQLKSVVKMGGGRQTKKERAALSDRLPEHLRPALD